MLNIEIKYVAVKWFDQDTVQAIEYSYPLKLEEVDQTYEVETSTFKKYQPRVAFRILDDEVLHLPYFRITNDEPRELVEIKDPETSEVWWIESCGWDKHNKWHKTELFRTAGIAELSIQNQTVKVINNTLTFSVEELEHYLSDFKNDLWMIIFNDQSHIKGELEKQLPSIFTSNLIELLNDYTSAIEKILKNLLLELRETQTIKPLNMVKPVKRTFMELATKGSPRHLSSRDFEESFDVPANRYIHYTLKRVLYIASRVNKLRESQQKSYERFVNMDKKRLDSIPVKTKIIDKDVFDYQIREFQQRLQQRLKGFKRKATTVMPIPSKQQINSDCKKREEGYKIQLGQGYGNSSFTYFCNQLNGDETKELLKNGKYEYLVIEVDLGELKEDFVNTYHSELKVVGLWDMCKETNQSGKEYLLLRCCRVDSVEIIKHPLEDTLKRLKTARIALDRKGWELPLSKPERGDFDRERMHIQRRLNLANEGKKTLLDLRVKIQPLIARLKKCKRILDSKKVKVDSHFPNTMVFVQNPSYSLAKSRFTKISKINGMDESLFDTMATIDQIGLVHTSNLYEKWCLIQIIKVLTEVYRFTIEDDWRKKLVTAVSKNQFDIEFKLTNKKLSREITLTYEKELIVSGNRKKRPDFVIDTVYDNGENQKRLVLDAKFKDNLDSDGMNTIVNELVEEKDYSQQNSNPVFVLHPSKEAIKERSSPLEWGRHSDYGQQHKHKYGAVYLSPSSNYGGRSIDNLQRLIGLFLQKSDLFEYNDDKSQLDSWNTFCIACGNNDPESLSIEQKKTKGGRDKFNVNCDSCSALQVSSFCKSCRAPLNKNGYYWTYHKTWSQAPFNIFCPNCGDYFPPEEIGTD